jgi:NAD(P)-dependent dehydrogenase (short-subunit alcohol dehydrogenase family)
VNIMDKLVGKKAIITGGASGIGRAAALLFAGAGAAVVIGDINDQGGEAVVKKIHAGGGEGIYVHCDVTKAEDCQRTVQKTINSFGGVDILFNNAGIVQRASVIDTTEEQWDSVMAVNVKSIFLMSKYTIPHMVQAGGGVILNTSSGWGLVGGRDAVSYCASKAAVVNLTRAMALDHGAQNIRVNCICPGDTDTPMLRVEARQLGENEKTFLDDAADRPLQRIGTPQDIAQAALYLCSDAASYVTGSTLVVDGGGLAG